jgi:iron complex outermembrane receptor protein
MKKYLVLVLMFLSVSLFSQEKVDTLKVVDLNDVVVVGNRPSANAPIAQKTISGLEIKKGYYGQEMTYILEKTPSVITQSDGGQPNGYTYFRIRGIDQTRINVTLNGSPLNEPEDMGVYFSNYPGFATFVKSAQVQRGVGASANGTASYGGSINFETKDGLDKGTNIELSIGSFNTQTYSVNYGSGLKKNKLSFFGGASTYTSDGYRQNSSGKGTSGFLSGGYFSDKSVIKLTAFTGKSINQMAWLPTPEPLIKFDRTTNLLSENDDDNFSQSFIQLQETHKYSNNFVSSSSIFYNTLNGVFDINDVSTSSVLNVYYRSHFYGYNTNIMIKDENFTTNSGVYVNMYDRWHFGNYNDVVDDTNDFLWDNVGYKNELTLYFKPEYKFDKFNFFGDLQVRNIKFDYVNKVKSPYVSYLTNIIKTSFINYRFGTTYQLNNSEKLYTYIGKTEREPTRTDIFNGNESIDNTDDTYMTQIIPTIETVTDFELGHKLNKEKLNVNTNFYFMYFKNQYLPTGLYGSNSLMIMEQVGKSFRTGIEFDLKYKILEGLYTSNNMTLSFNKILGNDIRYVLYSPNVIVNQDFDYTYKNFYINLSARFLSDSYINMTDKNDISPSYATLNSRVGYTNKNIDLSVSCINMTNTDYYTYGNVSHDGMKNYFVGTPRSFYTSLKIKF